ncbi:hypothetical protein Nepgr_011523 [Nepenthes gracilis]|uniref:Uncharacterized protein n=1 Tax=Nepenthes gracilis TaxID=150966 RepID=A0AAD3SEH8_NEPGR|nr:hypothetical protein Nepgr_011523 [Nepenthes gracilis]
MAGGLFDSPRLLWMMAVCWISMALADMLSPMPPLLADFHGFVIHSNQGLIRLVLYALYNSIVLSVVELYFSIWTKSSCTM